MDIDIGKELGELVLTVVYFIVGVGLFGLCILFIDKVTPFSIRKEIEEDHNVALGIIMGCALIALSIVLMAAIKS